MTADPRGRAAVEGRAVPGIRLGTGMPCRHAELGITLLHSLTSRNLPGDRAGPQDRAQGRDPHSSSPTRALMAWRVPWPPSLVAYTTAVRDPSAVTPLQLR